MTWVGRFLSRCCATCVLTVVLPAAAAAQDGRLKLPTMAAGAAAAADWASTFHGLKHYHVREVNPLLAPLQDSPGRLVSLGAVIDAGTVTAWNLTIGRNHPRLAAAGLWGMAVFRTVIAIQNLRDQRKALRRSHPSPSSRPREVAPVP